LRAKAKSDWSHWLAAGLGCVVLLILPAFYNRFPLMFPDTDAYLTVSYGHFWTLDRSGFYGLLLKPALMPASGVPGLWLALVLQVTIIAGLLIAVARAVAPETRPLGLLAVIAATCAVTSLPWHAAQLMPDAFTGVLILTAWITATRRADAGGTALLWLATACLGFMHYTHLVLLALAVAVPLAFAARAGAGLREIAKRTAVAVAAIAAVVAGHVVVNGAYFQRWTVSPMGSWFMFARLNEDGLVPMWLDRHCGRDAPAELCAIRAKLPRESQMLLWSTSSPLYPHIHAQIGTPEYWHWVDMLGAAAKGSLEEHPIKFAATATRNAAKQFVSFNAVDDQCPETCQVPAIARFRPDAQAALDNSRQLRGGIPKPVVRAVTNTAEGVGLVLLLPMFVLAVRRRDPAAQSLIATVAICIAANAFLGAALSAVNDRYQSRVVWIVPFIELLLLVRWRSAGRKMMSGAPLRPPEAGSA